MEELIIAFIKASVVSSAVYSLPGGGLFLIIFLTLAATVVWFLRILLNKFARYALILIKKAMGYLNHPLIFHTTANV